MYHHDGPIEDTTLKTCGLEFYHLSDVRNKPGKGWVGSAYATSEPRLSFRP